MAESSWRRAKSNPYVNSAICFVTKRVSRHLKKTIPVQRTRVYRPKNIYQEEEQIKSHYSDIVMNSSDPKDLIATSISKEAYTDIFQRLPYPYAGLNEVDTIVEMKPSYQEKSQLSENNITATEGGFSGDSRAEKLYDYLYNDVLLKSFFNK